MAPSLTNLGIDQLNVDDRLTLVHAIWDSIASDSAVIPLSDAQLAEVRCRAAKHDAGQGTTILWEEAEKEALAKLKK